MKIVDEPLLAYFRAKSRCELCGRSVSSGLDPHHLFAMGMGGGGRLDVALNLMAIDRECHGEIHAGKVPRAKLLKIVAEREGVTPDMIEYAIHNLLRRAKP